jgi:pyruvate dehydrogenase E1 component
MRRMYAEQENVFYYLTVMNENYVQPALPEGAEEGIIKGLYKLDEVESKGKAHVRLLGSGTILLQVRKAAEILAEKYGVSSDVYSATSFNELAREGQDVDRFNMLNPEAPVQKAYVTEVLEQGTGPVIAATDYIKSYADQIRAYVPAPYRVLGTDGFGRSDSRANLRRHFEVDHNYVVVAALSELARSGDIEASVVTQAIEDLGIDTDKLNPLYA